MGKLDDALLKFNFLVSDYPEYVGTYYHLGKLYQNMGMVEQAIITFQNGIKVAEQAGDMHSASELVGALEELG